MNKIIQATVLDNYRIDLTFNDGKSGIVDLSHLAGKGVFAAWNDYTIFRQVTIGETGELLWPGGLDLCPDSFYMKVTGQTPEQIFPNLNHELSHI